MLKNYNTSLSGKLKSFLQSVAELLVTPFIAAFVVTQASNIEDDTSTDF